MHQGAALESVLRGELANVHGQRKVQREQSQPTITLRYHEQLCAEVTRDGSLVAELASRANLGGRAVERGRYVSTRLGQISAMRKSGGCAASCSRSNNSRKARTSARPTPSPSSARSRIGSMRTRRRRTRAAFPPDGVFQRREDAAGDLRVAQELPRSHGEVPRRCGDQPQANSSTATTDK